MIVYVNSKNEIKDVGSTTDSTLTKLVINDEGNPFANWSVAKICCHMVAVKDGVVVRYIPYVDTKIIEHIDKLGVASDAQKVEILDLFEGQSDILYELSLLEIDML